MNLAMDWSRQMLAATYVVSAISKLAGSGGRWIWQTPNFALQIRKANDMQYYSTLEASPGHVDWLARLLLDHPWLARFVIGAALPLELFAFLGCFNRRLGAIVGLVLIGFHSTVSELMQLGFALNKYLLFIFFVNLPFWLCSTWKKFRTRFSA
jgi:hypothetical protein